MDFFDAWRFAMLGQSDSVFVFGLWQILGLVGIIVVLIAYKVWKNKTMG